MRQGISGIPGLSPFLLGLAVAAALAGLAAPATAAQFTVVTTAANTFEPADLTINQGDTVVFQNASQGIHNVDANDHSFRCANGCDGQGGDGSLSSSAWTFQLTFSQPGTVGYFCDNHGFPNGGMHGTIHVAPAAAVLCTPDANTLCLGAGGRFKATVGWTTADGSSGQGSAVPLASKSGSGLFYFFSAANIEMLLKVIDACAPPFNAYWVFFAATTNVQMTLTVTDTKTGLMKVYTNPLNQAARPVQDTSTFATCP